jgi:hypothetical protein
MDTNHTGQYGNYAGRMCRLAARLTSEARSSIVLTCASRTAGVLGLSALLIFA